MGVALWWPCGRFGVALYSGVYAEYMASIWLVYGFGWLCLFRGNSVTLLNRGPTAGSYPRSPTGVSP
jgi:hypothetical protein